MIDLSLRHPASTYDVLCVKLMNIHSFFVRDIIMMSVKKSRQSQNLHNRINWTNNFSAGCERMNKLILSTELVSHCNSQHFWTELAQEPSGDICWYCVEAGCDGLLMGFWLHVLLYYVVLSGGCLFVECWDLLSSAVNQSRCLRVLRH